MQKVVARVVVTRAMVGIRFMVGDGLQKINLEKAFKQNLEEGGEECLHHRNIQVFEHSSTFVIFPKEMAARL